QLVDLRIGIAGQYQFECSGGARNCHARFLLGLRLGRLYCGSGLRSWSASHLSITLFRQAFWYPIFMGLGNFPALTHLIIVILLVKSPSLTRSEKRSTVSRSCSVFIVISCIPNLFVLGL